MPASTAAAATAIVSTVPPPPPAVQSGALSPAQIGGIVGGIVGGFILLGPIVIFFLRRRISILSKPPAFSQHGRPNANSSDLDATKVEVAGTRLQYPEKQYQVGGRVKKLSAEYQETGGRVGRHE